MFTLNRIPDCIKTLARPWPPQLRVDRFIAHLQVWLPVALVQARIRGEIAANLQAVGRYSERIFSQQGNGQQK